MNWILEEDFRNILEKLMEVSNVSSVYLAGNEESVESILVLITDKSDYIRWCDIVNIIPKSYRHIIKLVCKSRDYGTFSLKTVTCVNTLLNSYKYSRLFVGKQLTKLIADSYQITSISTYERCLTKLGSQVKLS